jgi:hypothetical protein
MKLRKVTSLTALLSFILLTLTSLILYVVPHGRVAYWSDWRLWGLSKTQWGNLHINLGFLFLLSVFVHIYLNWKPMVSYLKNQSKQLTVFTAEFNVSLVLLVAFSLGTYFTLPPFSWVLNLNEAVKERAIAKYGEPPYGHAELSSLKVFTQKTGLDLSEAMAQLKAAGIEFDNGKQTIQAIASLNGMKPKDVYLAMLPEETEAIKGRLPLDPQPGLGRLTLAELCSKYGLDESVVLKALADEGIKATSDQSIRDIGQQNQVSPMDVYMTIKNGVDSQRRRALRPSRPPAVLS